MIAVHRDDSVPSGYNAFFSVVSAAFVPAVIVVSTLFEVVSAEGFSVSEAALVAESIVAVEPGVSGLLLQARTNPATTSKRKNIFRIRLLFSEPTSHSGPGPAIFISSGRRAVTVPP